MYRVALRNTILFFALLLGEQRWIEPDGSFSLSQQAIHRLVLARPDLRIGIVARSARVPCHSVAIGPDLPTCSLALCSMRKPPVHVPIPNL